jgi:hypothetical protein
MTSPSTAVAIRGWDNKEQSARAKGPENEDWTKTSIREPMLDRHRLSPEAHHFKILLAFVYRRRYEPSALLMLEDNS